MLVGIISGNNYKINQFLSPNPSPRKTFFFPNGLKPFFVVSGLILEKLFPSITGEKRDIISLKNLIQSACCCSNKRGNFVWILFVKSVKL